MTGPILVTGANGQVGTELRLQGGAGVRAAGHRELDITDAAAVEAMIAGGGFWVVINAAAYTAVDRAESDVAAAWTLNALGPAILAAATAKAGIPLVHLSTDYVFDGTAAGPYGEDAPIAPLGVYGASKEGGEQAVRTANPRHVILRTAWVVSAHGANFVKTMLRLGAEREVVRVVADQHGNPTSAADIAAACLIIAKRLGDPASPSGTYHFVNAGAASWYDFAGVIFAEAARRGASRPRVEPIATSDYPTAARRPANSRLATSRITRDYGIHPAPWQSALAPILDALAGPVSALAAKD